MKKLNVIMVSIKTNGAVPEWYHPSEMNDLIGGMEMLHFVQHDIYSHLSQPF
jgi:hypothetical protein